MKVKYYDLTKTKACSIIPDPIPNIYQKSRAKILHGFVSENWEEFNRYNNQIKDYVKAHWFHQYAECAFYNIPHFKDDIYIDDVFWMFATKWAGSSDLNSIISHITQKEHIINPCAGVCNVTIRS